MTDIIGDQISKTSTQALKCKTNMGDADIRNVAKALEKLKEEHSKLISLLIVGTVKTYHYLKTLP